MKLRILKVVLFVCVIITCQPWRMAFSKQKLSPREILRLNAKHANIQRQIHGRVFDFEGNPIGNAKVEVHVHTMTPYGSYDNDDKFLLTDKNGRFKAHFVGCALLIYSVEKDGYEFSRRLNKRVSVNHDDMKPLVTSKDKPVIFRLRKRSVPEYLIKEKLALMGFSRDKESMRGIPLFWDWLDEDGHKTEFKIDRPVNSIRQKLIEFKQPTQKQKEAVIRSDVLIECNPVGESGEIQLKFSPLVENLELLLTDQLLYEAPEKGYSSEVSVAVPPFKRSLSDDDYNIYLYARGKKGDYYSRVDIGVSPDITSIILGICVYTNPSGSRGFEYDPEYQSQEGGRRRRIGGKREEAKYEIYKKRIAAKKECRRKGIKFDEKKFNEENKFDEEKFMEKIRAEEAEAKNNKPLKWWDKLKKEKESMQ